MSDFHSKFDRLKYERTLQFIAFMALNRLFPESRALAEYSVGRGLYITVQHHYLNSMDLNRIQNEIKQISKQNHPIITETWERKEAISYFLKHDRKDKAELIEKLPDQKVKVYRCDDYVDDLYEDLLPTTSLVKTFDIISFFPGFVLQYTAPDNIDEVARFTIMPKHLTAYKHAKKWCDLTKLENTVDFYNAKELHCMRNYIRVNEVLHDEEIGKLADQIMNCGKKIVMIAGPSSSGKTTFAARLGIHLMVRGKQFLRLSLDDYYRNRSDLLPGQDGKIDLESLDALDVPLIFQQLTALLKGETVEIPRFDFTTQSRAEKGVITKLNEDDILIVEGIHGLNPALIDKNKAFHVFISPLTCLNVDDHNRIHTRDLRLLRRLVRDRLFRGTPPDETLNMWESVKAGEDRWIFSYQEMADFVFNSALHYELPVLKKYAYPMLKSCKSDQPNAVRLLHFLDLWPDFDDELLDEIPPLSLLREFIGGGTAEK